MNKIQLTKDQITQIVAVVFFTGLFLFAYLSYFWLPLGKKIAEKNARVAAIESDIGNAKAQKAKYKNLEAKLVSLQLEKDAAQKKLPRERKFPELIRTITDLSKKHRITVTSISQPSTSQVEYFMKVSYSLTVSGNYHDMGRFLTALGIEERILASENLSLQATVGRDTSVSATFTLVAYQYNG
ncbi:MAG TPA: type 4a pilus biogenesis protein PilO [Elusimicrobiales bacterium]|nr:type 4a pilus biogenesis protein PilO [Elusimicrobiales bacterium]